MAEAILYQMTATLLGNIASPAMQEISLAWHVESDLERLNSNLSAIHGVLQDAEDKRAKSRQLDDWLLKLKDFVYDAEDLIDEFQYEALRRRVLKSESTRRKDDDANATSNSFVETCISRFKYMRTLDLGSSSVEVLSRSIGNFKHLRILRLSNYKSIKKLPKSICKLLNLQSLYLNYCSELEELPKDIGKYLISLRILCITTKQTSLEVGCLPTSLRHLEFHDCKNLKSLGEGMQCLTFLRTLCIVNYKSLERLPRGLNCSTTLENLVLRGLGEIDTMEFEEDTGGNLPPSLRYLSIFEVPKIKALLPWLQGSAHSLRTLHIGGCPELSALPEGMNHLTELTIVDFPELSALPEGMNHLTELLIDDCPKLTNRCQPETGEDWPKIAHVPKIAIDFKIIK